MKPVPDIPFADSTTAKSLDTEPANHGVPRREGDPAADHQEIVRLLDVHPGALPEIETDYHRVALVLGARAREAQGLVTVMFQAVDTHPDAGRLAPERGSEGIALGIFRLREGERDRAHR